jgi:hypothetical protein
MLVALAVTTPSIGDRMVISGEVTVPSMLVAVQTCSWKK